MIKPRGTAHPVRMRSGRSSDLSVFWQIFVNREYAVLNDVHSTRLIIDLGANVGISSAYLLNQFPSAKVIAVEPDPGNYELCCRI